MNLDDLKAEWRAEVQVSEGSGLRLDRIKGDVAQWNREVRFGNYVAIIASVSACVLAVVFGWLTQEAVRPEQKIAITAYVIFAAWLTYSLLKARHVSRSDTWTLRARLEVEIERLERQRNLWKNGGLFMLVPMVIYFALSLPPHLYPVPIAVCALVYWLSRRTARRRIEPLLSRLQNLYRELTGGEAGTA